MSKIEEIEFKVSSWELSSDYDVFWWSKGQLAQSISLTLEGDFLINQKSVMGTVNFSANVIPHCDQSNDDPASVDNEDVDIGTIRVDPEKPGASLDVPESFINSLLQVLTPNSSDVIIQIRSNESVLYQRRAKSVVFRTKSKQGLDKPKGFLFSR
jgi:hypothetical protein